MAFPFEVFAAEKNGADLVVYGKIFTSEGNQIVEAFAVKDGKFVYVGDKNGVKDFIKKGKTEIVSAAVKKARDTGATSIFGVGWDLFKFEKNMPTRQQLDEICSDIPMYIAEEEGHKGIVNTLALVNAGIMSADGKVLKKEIRGGEIVFGADGTPTGYLKEQAGTYTRSFLDNDRLFSVDLAKATMLKVERHLLSEGYTMYLDGMDKSGKMNFVLGLTYEIESWMDIDSALNKALDVQKYSSKHVKTNWIKLFMDGTVETGTGFIEPLYPDGHQGIPNWSEEEVTDITRKANAKNLTMHIHTMGNMAVNRAVNAYVNGGYKRMAENNIYVTSGMLWHAADDDLQADLLKKLPAEISTKGYPIKSFFDNGIEVSSHSDFPALSGSPDDPFGIIEVAVTGVKYNAKGKVWWKEELITREQALTALTINVARQMFLENERGSIRAGKYADFLLVNKDVLTCPVTEIHTAKPSATYFEGKKVFSI